MRPLPIHGSEKRINEGFLEVVGVLIFVHHDVFEPTADVVGDIPEFRFGH